MRPRNRSTPDWSSICDASAWAWPMKPVQQGSLNADAIMRLNTHAATTPRVCEIWAAAQLTRISNAS